MKPDDSLNFIDICLRTDEVASLEVSQKAELQNIETFKDIFENISKPIHDVEQGHLRTGADCINTVQNFSSNEEEAASRTRQNARRRF